MGNAARVFSPQGGVRITIGFSRQSPSFAPDSNLCSRSQREQEGYPVCSTSKSRSWITGKLGEYSNKNERGEPLCSNIHPIYQWLLDIYPSAGRTRTAQGEKRGPSSGCLR